MKEHIGHENYVNNAINTKNRIAMTKLRLSNHKLMIEVGRHNKIDINSRLCPTCLTGIETEIHFLFDCPI